MNLKKMIYINTIITFVICFLVHFLYEILPNNIFAIFFPVNESVWEHMKMLYTSILISSIIEYFIMKKFNIIGNNNIITSFLKSILIIPIYLIMYYPLNYLIGENFIINIIIMLSSIFIVNLLGYRLIDNYEIKNQKLIGIILIIFIYIGMAILTFYPPKAGIFYDKEKKVYGIPTNLN